MAVKAAKEQGYDVALWLWNEAVTLMSRLKLGLISATLLMLPLAVMAAERHMMQSRVPADKLAEAQALTSPLPASPEIVEKGKALYNGKGTCFNCHGQDGAGNGPAAAQLDPAPRNFQHHGFWRHRAEGEIFWVIKNGSPGTSMVGFGSVLTDDEIWSLIQYERTFGRHHGPRKGMREMDGRGPMGREQKERDCCQGQDEAK